MEVTTLQLALAGACAVGVGFWFGWWSKHRQQSTQRAMLDELWTRKLRSYEQALEQAQTADIHTSTRAQGVQRELAAVRADLAVSEERGARLAGQLDELEQDLEARVRRTRELEQSRERIGRELVVARRELVGVRETLAAREQRLAALERLPGRLDEREAELAQLEVRLRELSLSKDTEIARLKEWVDDLTHLPSALARREAELRESSERLGVVEVDAERRVEQLRSLVGERETVQKKLEQRLRRLREEQEQDRRRALAAREELAEARARLRELGERHAALELRLAEELAAREALLATERAIGGERSREYERSTQDLGREYERTLAERCDEYERWIAAREAEHQELLAGRERRAHGELVETAGEYEALLVEEHLAGVRRFAEHALVSDAGLGAAAAAAALERQRLQAAAAEELARAEAETDAVRSSLRSESDRAAALEGDLHAAALEYESTLAEVYVTGARAAAPPPLLLAGSAPGPAPGLAPRILLPGEVLEVEQAGAVAGALDPSSTSEGPELAPDPEEALARLLSAPPIEWEAAASPYELALARQRAAALAPSAVADAVAPDSSATVGSPSMPEAAAAPGAPASAESIDPRARRMRARPRRARELRPQPPPSLPVSPFAAEPVDEFVPELVAEPVDEPVAEPAAVPREPADEPLRQAELRPHPPPAGAALRRSPSDELMRVRGIGPKLAERLVAVGCDSLLELANLADARVEELARELKIPPTRIRRERWRELARDLLP